MPRSVRVFAPAKLNLGLELLARRPDGYHDIQTLFLPLRWFDRIELGAAAEPGVHLRLWERARGLPDGPDNLAVRAALETCRALGWEPALEVGLFKQLPVAAGLGGGSSDAAAVILGMEVLTGRSLDPDARSALARELGADVPFFLDPRPALGRGIGDQLEPLRDVPDMWWVLVLFDFGVPTPWAYQTASARLTLPREGSSIAALLGPSGILTSPPNDLEGASSERHPEIGQARQALRDAGARVTGMSGSGPTVYGRFADAGSAIRAAQQLRVPAGARTIAVSSPGSARRQWGWGVAKW